jgi:CO dehydrogenase maturation factor
MDLVTELNLVVRKQLVVVNMAPDELAPMVNDELVRLGIDSPVLIPRDEEIYRYDLEAKPLVDLPDSSKAVMAIDNIMDDLVSVKA